MQQDMSQLQNIAVREGSSHIDDILRLNACSTVAQVNSTLERLTAKLGFDYFEYRGRFNIDGARHLDQVITNYNPLWRQRYDSQAYQQCDPAVLHAAVSLRPLVWCDKVYTSATQQSFRAEARRYGLTSGVTFPVQSRKGEFAFLNFALNRAGQTATSHIQARLPYGAFAATLAHEAVNDVVRKTHTTDCPKLTERETDVLKWVAAGKTSWEISCLLSISSHGVIFHIRNILQKFDVTSRHQAVVRAMAFGIL